MAHNSPLYSTSSMRNSVYSRNSHEKTPPADDSNFVPMTSVNFNDNSSDSAVEGSPMRAGLEEGTSQKRKRRRLKHPLQPKHPCSAFLFYLTAERSRVAAENPRCSVGQVSKLVGQKWRKMSASEKSSWEAKARADKERYAREMEIWNATQEGSKEDLDYKEPIIKRRYHASTSVQAPTAKSIPQKKGISDIVSPDPSKEMPVGTILSRTTVEPHSMAPVLSIIKSSTTVEKPPPLAPKPRPQTRSQLKMLLGRFSIEDIPPCLKSSPSTQTPTIETTAQQQISTPPIFPPSVPEISRSGKPNISTQMPLSIPSTQPPMSLQSELLGVQEPPSTTSNPGDISITYTTHFPFMSFPQSGQSQLINSASSIHNIPTNFSQPASAPSIENFSTDYSNTFPFNLSQLLPQSSADSFQSHLSNSHSHLTSHFPPSIPTTESLQSHPPISPSTVSSFSSLSPMLPFHQTEFHVPSTPPHRFASHNSKSHDSSIPQFNSMRSPGSVSINSFGSMASTVINPTVMSSPTLSMNSNVNSIFSSTSSTHSTSKQS